jgi:two-component system chemotaxis sensor kinase CheA
MATTEHGLNGMAALHDGETAWHVQVMLEKSCVLKAVRAYMVIKRLARLGRIMETHPTEREIEDELFDRSFEVILASSADENDIRAAVLHVSEIETVETVPLMTTAPPHGEVSPVESVLAAQQLAREAPKVAHAQTVRVAIGHLDTLVDLAGELVIMRSRLDRIAAKSGNAELLETLEELHRVSSELQYEIMQTRMVPVGNIFNRFPRMVRDLSVELGKRVDFYLEGLDIELDRTVLDEIGDPLVHLLRNSLDHGVEPSEERVLAGKPTIASVHLSARRERDHVAIIVSDDGRGIDPELVWTAAVERGLVSAAERSDYDDAAILMFACMPGFSTTEQATKVSGRGVGLDAVKGKIEYLGGTLQIRSELGAGTEFVLRLPMTLAIIQALIVEASGQSYALPLSVVDEVYDSGDVRVDTVDGAPVVVLRTGEIVPLARLDALLSGGDVHGLPDDGSSVVLVQSGTVRYALCVDELGGRREIVVKPLSRLLREAHGFSGATILGDGRVMLILDPRTLFSTQEA